MSFDSPSFARSLGINGSMPRIASLFALARRAGAEQLQPVAFHTKTGLAGCRLYHVREIAPLELDRTVTDGADGVMVMSSTGEGIAVAALLQVHAPDQAQVGQDLQSPIDGGQADAWAASSGLGVHLGCIQALARRKHNTQHSATLLGILVPVRAQFSHKTVFVVLRHRHRAK